MATAPVRDHAASPTAVEAQFSRDEATIGGFQAVGFLKAFPPKWVPVRRGKCDKSENLDSPGECMATTPAVSVLMPVRNGERWLEQSLRSIAQQTVREFEFLVVDNGSTDRTPEILARACAEDERFVALNEPHRGIVPALNTGLAAARAPLIARLDADDMAMPNRLERQLDFMARHPEVGLLGSWADVIDTRGKVYGHRRPVTGHEDLVRILKFSNPFIHPAVMFRAGLVRRLGGYRAAFEVSEDYDLWLRMAEVTVLANLPEPLVFYRLHAGNLMFRKVVRQSFSVHLAQCSARLRREQGHDPVDAMLEAPRWWERDSDNSFYAEEARLFRLLGLADRKAVEHADLEAIESVDPAELGFALNGTDRKLARRAIANLALRSGLRRPMARLRLINSLWRLSNARGQPPARNSALAPGSARANPSGN
jgi:glycosyltransferase involved in cell wall biosynthesis